MWHTMEPNTNFISETIAPKWGKAVTNCVIKQLHSKCSAHIKQSIGVFFDEYL